MPSADTILLLMIAVSQAVNSYFSYKAKAIGEANHVVGIANHGLSLDIRRQTNGAVQRSGRRKNSNDNGVQSG